ncbi:hypothetical protein SDC9_196956 [bioreactor metagenome]|uniref:Uncharacterized protein n=1 Tax=bioreactor metagenome TaxID=1076179 RepID=A0A645IDE9_9ZZZZ
MINELISQPFLIGAAVAKNLHPQSIGLAGQLEADIPQPDDADRFAADFHLPRCGNEPTAGLRIRPIRIFNDVAVRLNIFTDIKQKPQRELSDRFRTVDGIRHGHTILLRQSFIHFGIAVGQSCQIADIWMADE